LIRTNRRWWSKTSYGEFFGFASMLEQTRHQTDAAVAVGCLEVDRNDIAVLLQRKPLAGMDMMTLSRQIHNAQQLVRLRASRNPNDIIERSGPRRTDRGHGCQLRRIVDIYCFCGLLAAYVAVSVSLGNRAWDPYPFILLNLFSDAGRDPGADYHDESEPAGHEGSSARRVDTR
jgi:hypothetical protein